MVKNPQNTKPQKEASSENATAVDDGRTKQALEVAETRQRPEGDVGAADRAESGASSPAKTHPKVHKSGEEGPVQDTASEPVVEDEP
jgi:hypothetical protein